MDGRTDAACDRTGRSAYPVTRRHRTSSGIARPATAPSDPAGAFRRRLGLIFTQKIAGDLPDVDRDVIETVVTRTLALLAGSARHAG